VSEQDVEQSERNSCSAIAPIFLLPEMEISVERISSRHPSISREESRTFEPLRCRGHEDTAVDYTDHFRALETISLNLYLYWRDRRKCARTCESFLIYISQRKGSMFFRVEYSSIDSTRGIICDDLLICFDRENHGQGQSKVKGFL